jgi:hypothetical protein
MLSVGNRYNPVLGEFFRCRYDYSNGTRGFYVAEQGKWSSVSPLFPHTAELNLMKPTENSVPPPTYIRLLLHFARESYLYRRRTETQVQIFG